VIPCGSLVQLVVMQLSVPFTLPLIMPSAVVPVVNVCCQSSEQFPPSSQVWEQLRIRSGWVNLPLASVCHVPRVAPTSIFMSASLTKPGSSLPPTSGFWEKREARNRGADMDGNVCATREIEEHLYIITLGSGMLAPFSVQYWAASVSPVLAGQTDEQTE